MIVKTQGLKVILLFSIFLVLISFSCDLTGHLELTVDNSSDSTLTSISVNGSNRVGEPMVFYAITDLTEVEFQWFVNGISAGYERSLSWSFTEKGFYRIVLVGKIAFQGDTYQITTVSKELFIQ